MVRGEFVPQNAQLAAASLVGAVGEVLIGPLSSGGEHPDTVADLVGFSLRALGVHHDCHA